MTRENLLSEWKQHFEQIAKNDALTALREKSWLQFLNSGLPDKSNDAYRYVSLRELYSACFESAAQTPILKSDLSQAVFPECRHSHLVFIDGYFSLELSDISALPKQVILLTLIEALRSHGSFLQNHFNRTLKEENDPFALANFALHPQGAFFYLPPKMQVDVPVQCLYVTTSQKSQTIVPRLYVALGAHSQMRVISSYHSLEPQATHLLLPAVDVALEDNASLNWLSITDSQANSWHIESNRVTLKKNARFDSLSVTTGAKVLRQSYRVQLKGENSEANLNGLWMLAKNHTAHTHAAIEHEAPHTRSMQLFKGVLNDASQSSFEGQIFVKDVAQKTQAYQLNNNLILSQGAIANSKPNLKIFADDVKASHGATMSQIDEEQLFYLKARGISSAEAKRMLIGGFCREMIEQIPYPSIKRKMQQHIQSVINTGDL